MFARSPLKLVLAAVTVAIWVGLPSTVSAHEIEPGDWVVTADLQTPIKVRKETLLVLAKNTELPVEQVNGDWIAVTVLKDEKRVRGWIHVRHVDVLRQSPAADAEVPGGLITTSKRRIYTAFSLKAARERIGVATTQREFHQTDAEAYHLGGITAVRGLVVDPASGDAIIVGEYVAGRARLTLDDLVVALRARFVHDQWPVVSIDPPASRNAPRVHTVRFEGAVADTQFGQDLFDADYLLKRMSLGYVASNVPGVQSKWDMWLEESRRNQQRNVHIRSRAWFFPIISATPSRRNVAAYKGLKVGVFSEVLAAQINGQPVQDLTQLDWDGNDRFVAAVREHYATLAAMHPAFRRIEQLNELVALSRAVEVMEQRPDLDWWLEEYPLRSVKTPAQVEELARSETFHYSGRRYYRTISMSGGVQLRAMALRLNAGDVSALSDAVLNTRTGPDALSWRFAVDDWVIPLPPEVAITKGAEVTPHYVFAQFLIRQGHYEQALNRLDKILEVEPNYIDAWYLKGCLLNDRLKRYKDAIACFDATLQKNPDLAGAYYGRAMAYLRSRNAFKAHRDFDQAVRLKPKVARAWAGRGLCRASLRDFGGALTDLDEAIRLDRRLAIAYSLRGDVFRRQNKLDQAMDDLNKAITFNPNLSMAYYNRGLVFAKRGDYEQAIEDYSETIRLNPRCQPAYASRSDAYRHTRQFEEGLADAELAKRPLIVEVADAEVSLTANGSVVAKVARGKRLEIIRVQGNLLWVTGFHGGRTVQGWMHDEFVQ